MPDFIALTCPTCGGKLQITNDIERFACGNCGNEHIVQRSGGIVSLAPVVQGIKRIQTGVDKTASELAIQRLKDEIAVLQQAMAEAESRAVAHANEIRGARVGRVISALFWTSLPIIAILGMLLFTQPPAGPSDKQAFYTVCGGLAVLLLVPVILAWRGVISAKQPIIEEHTEVNRLRGLIAQKYAELKRHQEIVRN